MTSAASHVRSATGGVTGLLGRVALLAVASAFWAGCALLPGCETKADEPLGKATRAAGAAPQPSVSGGYPAGPPLAPPPRGRCVRETPPSPSRTVEPGADMRCPEPDAGIRRFREAVVRFPQVGKDLTVEVAERHEDRMRGMMYRKEQSEDRGMLFVFQEREPMNFWMRDTCIPLDMLFIDADGLIVGIEENVPTLNDNSYGVGCPSLYVLEVNAGWSRRHGVMAGQYLDLSRIGG